jgi:EamA domain-containing membrane protein RarD
MFTPLMILRILFVVATSLAIYHLLRKKGKVKRERPAIIGLIASVHAIVRLIVYSTQGKLDLTNLLTNLTFLLLGVTILFIWGVRSKNNNKRSV